MTHFLTVAERAYRTPYSIETLVQYGYFGVIFSNKL